MQMRCDSGAKRGLRSALSALALMAGAVGLTPGLARAAEGDKAVVAQVQQFTTQRIIYNPTTGQTRTNVLQPRGPGGCPPIAASVANRFADIDVGTEVTLQLGMVVGEAFGSTYVVADPVPGTPQNEAFPIEVTSVEFLIATVAAGIGSDIEMGYRIQVWDGEPGVAGSILAFEVASDPDPGSTGLPADARVPRVPSGSCDDTNVYLTVGFGGSLPASAARVNFSVDPGADPADRVIVANSSGTNRVTILVYMDRANVPAGSCTILSPCSNAFLLTEGASVNGSGNGSSPTFPTLNWLDSNGCPPLLAGFPSCPAGIFRFSSSSVASCRPTRDVLQQITYTTSQCVGVIQGACCTATGNCAAQTSANCTSSGGTYQGDNTVCSPNPCPQPSGACCSTTGACSVTTSSSCTTSGGTFQGAGSVCSPNPCPQPTGACCASNGACATLNQTDCAQFGGTFIPATACTINNTCPLGSCCLPDGSCIGGVSSAACASQNGLFQGVSSTCGTVTCPQPNGACCTSTGGCASVTQATCSLFGGTWAGAFTSCPGACAPAGVCCRGATCATGITSGNCTAPSGIGASFASAASACNASGNTLAPCCHADFNKTGGVTVADIFDYLNAWFLSSPYADFGGDGSSAPVVQDIFDYLNAWFAGGC